MASDKSRLVPPAGVSQVRDSLTYVPVRVETRFEGTSLGIGTAFFLHRAERTFLLTNWHVVSGRNPADGKPLHSKGAIPDSMLLRVPTHTRREDGAELRRYVDRLLPLYDDRIPVWFEHPHFRERVDVVAIPLGGIEETAVLVADHERHDLDDFRLYPSLDVFVLGFPKGMSGRGSTPIWKRGTIATEPDFDHDKLPMYLIDTATREGMSGSPVYAQEVGTWLPEGADDEARRILGKGRMFVGMYSGRLNADDEFKAQLGMVWKRQAIEEVIEAKQTGQSSLEFNYRQPTRQ